MLLTNPAPLHSRSCLYYFCNSLLVIKVGREEEERDKLETIVYWFTYIQKASESENTLPVVQGQQYSSYRMRDDVDVVSHLELIGSSTLVKEAVTVSNVPEASDIYALHVYYLQVSKLWRWREY